MTETDAPIAIVGIACRFPRAPSVESFWKLLTDGTDAISEWPRDRIGWRGDRAPLFGGFIEGIEDLDPQFFDLTAKEAASMDPQQRLLLELAWEALEDAGQPPLALKASRTGVFVGIMNPEYLLHHGNNLEAIDAQRCLGSALGIAANRLSYAFDLRGPSMATDTQCSSSLVSVHLACQSLRSGDSAPLAIAGGVNIILHPGMHAFYEAASLKAADARCKSFDARADGIVRGEGAGLVVLKALEHAQRDGDRVYAVIRGSAINHGGRTNGLTAPNPAAQESLLRDAYRRSGFAPGTVQYVEAHGTGTLIGDPIEAKALGAVMSDGRAPDHPCAIGSVKTNFGHLESAAGVAGLIKAALAVHHRTLPPSLHFERPNPYIDFAKLQLRVQQSLEPWPVNGDPLRAGVSSFGLGGANAHVVLEEAPARDGRAISSRTGPHLLLLSARSAASLSLQAERMAEHLSASSDEALRDVCFTASVRRSHLPHRLAAVASSREEMIARLEDAARGQAVRGQVVLLFSGNGSQWIGMGRALMEHEPAFRAGFQEADAAVAAVTHASLASELARTDRTLDEFERPDLAQPLLFAVQLGLYRWWRSIGLKPSAIAGHSVGEVAAAHAAGVLTIEDAARIVVERSRLIARASGGAMIVASLSAEAASALCRETPGVDIAGFNGPESIAMGGDKKDLEALGRVLDARGVRWRWIKIAFAAHTPRMEPLGRELVRILGAIRPQAERIPFYSAVTGARVRGESMDAAYWGQNVTSPVRLLQAMERIAANGPGVVIEVSPNPILLTALEPLFERAKISAVPTLLSEQDERRSLLAAAGRAHVHGVELDLASLQSGRFVPIPRYAWSRKKYALEAPQVVEPVASDPLLHRIEWTRSELSSSPRTSAGGWLILPDAGGVGAALAALLPSSKLANHLLDDFGPLAGVVDLRALDATADALDRSAIALTGRALSLVQDLAEKSGTRLWIATRGADRRPDHAALSGFGRTIAHELPASWGGTIDLDDRASNDEAARFIAAELTRGPFGAEVALRDGARWVPRIARCASAPRPLRFDPATTQLITGGLGALGLAVARWLVDRGARNLVLVGRKPPSRSALEKIAALEAAGARVLTFACDVTEDGALAEIEAKMPRVSGVFHLAAVIEDRPIEAHDLDLVARVMAPKVRGAVHLAQRFTNLDHFVMFSSASALLGSPGQAAYAAANAFLDAFGPRTLSVQFGPWSEIGVVDALKEKRLASSGILAVDPRRAIAALERAMAAPDRTVAVLSLDLPRLEQAIPGSLRDGLLAPLFGAKSGPAPVPLEKETPSPEKVFDVVRDRIARALGVPKEELDLEAPLYRLGLDSFAGTQLRGRLASDLDISVPIAAILSGSARSIAEHVVAAQNGAAPKVERPRSGGWITPIRSAPDAALTLFCFPYAGGGAPVFRAWASGLPENVDVQAIQLPGRGDAAGEPPLVRAEAIVEALVPMLREKIRGPFAFFGHCMGAILAYEVASRLIDRHGLVPEHLFMSGAPAPHLYVLPNLHSLPREKFLEMLQLIHFGSTEVLFREPEMLELALPSLRADFEVVAHYRHRPRARFDVPITAFSGFDDVFAPVRAVEAWREHTAAPFAIYSRPGDHYFLETDRGFLLETIGRALQARRTSSWIRAVEARPGAKKRILCFPAAGFDASAFAEWPAALGPEVEVLAVNLPGRGERLAEAPVRSVGAIVEALANEIAPLLDRPLYLFGHDIGAIEMFELASRIGTGAGGRIAGLIASAAVAPSLYAFSSIHQLDEEQFGRFLRFFGIEAPSSMHAARADFEAISSYAHRARPPLECPIAAVSFDADSFVPESGVEHWKEHTRGAFTIEKKSGDHSAWVRDPSGVLEVVRRVLHGL